MNLSKNEKIIALIVVVGIVLLVAAAFIISYTTPQKTKDQREQEDYLSEHGSSATGFSVLRPIAWNFQGSGYGAGNDNYGTTATVAFSNIAGIDLTVAVNGKSGANTTIIKFSKPGAALCGWYGDATILDQYGDKLTSSKRGTGSSEYYTIGIPAGQQVVVKGLLTGPGGPDDTAYTCGGPSGGAYRWTISYQTALDQYNIQHSDSGTITGQFQ